MSASKSAPWSLEGGFWRDERLSRAGLRHGVTTRALGDMKEPAARREALAAAGLSGRAAHFLRQAHGTGIVAVGEGAPTEPPPQGDGLVTRARGVVLCVYVADCLPIFLGAGARAAGVFHAGWRGLASGMARAAVSALTKGCGVAAGSLLASVGPHIGACCYRVGPEFSSRFRSEVLSARSGRARSGRAPSFEEAGRVLTTRGGGIPSPMGSVTRPRQERRARSGRALSFEEAARPRQERRARSGRLFLDLGAEARAQLVEAGVPAQSVALSAACTACSPGLFSFRRDKKDSRLMAFLSIDG